jgi:DNA-binding transcriptional LysR family regulator
VLTEWALAGEGIVLKPVFEMAEHIAAGRLVPILRDYPCQDVTLGVLYPTKRMAPPWQRDFMDLAVERLRRHVAEALARLQESPDP